MPPLMFRGQANVTGFELVLSLLHSVIWAILTWYGCWFLMTKKIRLSNLWATFTMIFFWFCPDVFWKRLAFRGQFLPPPKPILSNNSAIILATDGKYMNQKNCANYWIQWFLFPPMNVSPILYVHSHTTTNSKIIYKAQERYSKTSRKVRYKQIKLIYHQAI